MDQGKHYYEIIQGMFYLHDDDGEIQGFSSHHDMVAYVDDPDAEFVEVNDQNWLRLYREGVFHQ